MEKNFYNIGSNNMISNDEIVEKLVKLTNCNYTLDENVKTIFEPKIDIADMIKEFNFKPIKKAFGWIRHLIF